MNQLTQKAFYLSILMELKGLNFFKGSIKCVKSVLRSCTGFFGKEIPQLYVLMDYGKHKFQKKKTN